MSLKTYIEHLEATNEDLTNEIESIRQENKDLNEQLESAGDEIENLQAKLKEAKAKHEIELKAERLKRDELISLLTERRGKPVIFHDADLLTELVDILETVPESALGGAELCVLLRAQQHLREIKSQFTLKTVRAS